MASEQTQHQSDDERKRARDLSLKPSRPPGNVPGYSIQQFVGSGAYGEVWSGTDKKTGRRVAIKFYTRRSSEDVRQLAREVEKLVVLSADRYVVQLVDVGWDADPPYFVMDYIEHGSLEDRLKRGSLPPNQAVELCREVATGMMHLHGKGILHCDLKPGNVLLDQDGVPRLADFGQARLKSDKSASLGTLFYMAPEQADLDAVPDARWDVYSLGALLYAMLCGSPPYFDQIKIDKDTSITVSDRLNDYQVKIRNAEKPNGHRRIPGVDRSLADIIDRAIERDPKKRFANVQSFLLALRQRELAKQRQPLIILGLLGPLLLLGVMSWFAYTAYDRAVVDTHEAVEEKAKESNEFAAELAASRAAEHIDDYFRSVRSLISNPAFVADLTVALEDPDLERVRMQLTNPSDNKDESLKEVRAEFVANEKRQKVEAYLRDMLDDVNDQYPKAASWFVCDVYGNQIASVFDGKDNLKTIGRNYSYRTYFTGDKRDLKTERDGEVTYHVGDDPATRTIIARPHLSAVFLSQGTFTWKVAFSMPICIEDEICGIVAVTTETGNLVNFEDKHNQFAVLVDGREGDFKGVILEHPVFDRYTEKKDQVPKVTVDLDQVESTKRFDDPLGDTELGAHHDREWLAAVKPVTSLDYSIEAFEQKSEEQIAEEKEIEKRHPTGIFVIAAEDYVSVVEPVGILSGKLMRLALLAATFLLLVSVAMWLLVLRMIKESRLRLSRSFLPSGDSSITAQLETIEMPTQTR